MIVKTELKKSVLALVREGEETKSKEDKKHKQDRISNLWYLIIFLKYSQNNKIMHQISKI